MRSTLMLMYYFLCAHSMQGDGGLFCVLTYRTKSFEIANSIARIDFFSFPFFIDVSMQTTLFPPPAIFFSLFCHPMSSSFIFTQHVHKRWWIFIIINCHDTINDLQSAKYLSIAFLLGFHIRLHFFSLACGQDCLLSACMCCNCEINRWDRDEIEIEISLIQHNSFPFFQMHTSSCSLIGKYRHRQCSSLCAFFSRFFGILRLQPAQCWNVHNQIK